MDRSYNVLIQRDEDEGYFAFVPSVPGVVDQGDTPEEAYQNTLAALRFHLGCLVEDGEELPPSDPGPGELRRARVAV